MNVCAYQKDEGRETILIGTDGIGNLIFWRNQSLLLCDQAQISIADSLNFLSTGDSLVVQLFSRVTNIPRKADSSESVYPACISIPYKNVIYPFNASAKAIRVSACP